MTTTRTDSSAGLTLALAAALGLAADRLLPNGPMGPGFALWILCLGGAATMVATRRDPTRTGAVAAWSMIAFAAMATTSIRDTDVAFPFMLLVLGTSASMVLLRAGGVRLWNTKPTDHVLGLALVPARALSGVLPLLGDLKPSEDSSRRRLVAAGRGALLAAPLLLLFGALFASADAGFNRFLSEDVFTHVAIVLVFGWVAAGLLSGVRANRLPDPLGEITPPRLVTEEIAVGMGLLALLFLVFVGFQLGYLFGGQSVIESTSGLTVAEYARRGFGELVVVGVLTIGVLLVGDALTTDRRVFKWLAGVLIACVLIILASAAQRLMLYTDAFGLTVDRITAAAIEIWVAVVLVLFAATMLRDQPRRFSSGAMLAGMATAFSLVAFNPDLVAARSNLDRAAAGVRPADADFLGRLSGDAVPLIVQRFGELPVEAQCALGPKLVERWAGEKMEGRMGDWRTWNAAGAAARHAVLDARAMLVPANCATP